MKIREKRGTVIWNSVTAKNDPSLESKTWWSIMDDATKAEVIVRHHPDCMKQSPLARIALFNTYDRNPQILFDLETA